jgi:hypothetical protein
MNSANPTPGEVQRAIDETMRAFNLITSGLALTMAALAGRSLVKAVASATR